MAAVSERMVLMLACLSPRQKAAVRLKAEGHSRAECARAMGVTPAHVKNLWAEARHRMRAQMEPAEIAYWDAKFLYGPAQRVRPMSLSDVKA